MDWVNRMSTWHGEIGRKRTGGKIHLHRKKRKFELGNQPIHTTVGKEKKKFESTKGGNIKVKVVRTQFVNVYDSKSKKLQRVKILDVLRNPANPHFVRRGIVTKGCILKTELGEVRVTSRPSQSGVVNAVALTAEEKK
jgi:small subunit ribosomal protein S8e